MAATASRMVALGEPVPDFVLQDVRSGVSLSAQQLRGRPLLVMFICNHCPYVIHVIETLAAVANQAQLDGWGVVAISSNDIENYPQDGPDHMQAFATQYGFNFPYCYDESQAVAKAFQAACTPDFFIYDDQHRLAYRGQMDGSRPGNAVPVTGDDLKQAISAVEAGQPCRTNQIPSLGCNIKWKQPS